MLRNYNRRMSKFFEKPTAFLEVLKSTHALVAGRFTLECITDEVLCPSVSCFDLFVGDNHLPTVISFLKLNAYYFEDEYELTMFCEVDHPTAKIRFYHAYNACYIEVTRRPSPESCIAAVSRFDYSFLMSSFDGTKFRIWFPLDIIERVGYYNEVKAREHYYLLFFFFNYTLNVLSDQIGEVQRPLVANAYDTPLDEFRITCRSGIDGGNLPSSVNMQCGK
jgi:hypothetical protein